MSGELPKQARADAVRSANDVLDERLRAIAGDIPAELLHVDPGNGEWTLAENLAHVAEFAGFFAADLAAQLNDEGATVGRTHEHPDRNAAIALARGQSPEDLRSALEHGLRTLAEQLGRLNDEHLDRQGHNRKYGPEPLHRFLDRYVLEHKAAHVRQLEATMRNVQR